MRQCYEMEGKAMICWCYDCCHNRNFECQLGANVEITPDHECDSFVDYLDTEIYKQPFDRRVEHDGVQYKRKCYGKREEQNGIVFYHLAKELSNGTFCTEEKTGLGFEYRRILYDNYLAEMEKQIKQIPSVNTLPDEPEVEERTQMTEQNNLTADERYCCDCIHNEVCRYCPHDGCDFKETQNDNTL